MVIPFRHGVSAAINTWVWGVLLKIAGGLAQVLLILAVLFHLSAMLALGDWRKSLNWGKMVVFAPIANFPMSPPTVLTALNIGLLA